MDRMNYGIFTAKLPLVSYSGIYTVTIAG